MAARLVRHVAALAGPAGLFAWWMLGRSPITLGTAAILAVPALVLAAGVLALVARRRRPRVGSERIAALLLFAVGAALTAGYWARVWSYRDWDMGGILVGAANIVGFWWPAMAIALAMWTLEELGVAPGGWPRFRARVGAALLGGIVGAAAFHYGDRVYHERVERDPLERAVGVVAHDMAPLARTPLPYRLEAGHLQIDADAGPAVGDRPYVVLRTLDRGLVRARGLTDRKDVTRVTLVLRARGGELVRFQAAEADRGRPVWELTRLDRTRLKDGGRLDAGSLDAMLAGWTPDNRERFLQWFTAAAEGAEVTVAFRPQAPPSPDTMELYGAAWASANNIVREIARYFPDIARVRVTLPRLSTVVEPREVGPDFRLQHRMVPPGRVLGLVLRERGVGEATLEAAKFQPLIPLPGFQTAVMLVTPHLTEHEAGVLFERLERFGWVLDVADDGTATLILDDGRGVRTRPLQVRPGDAATVDGRTLHNVGWLPRSAFSR